MRRIEMRKPRSIVKFFPLIACLSIPVQVWAQSEGRPCSSKPVNMSTFYGDMITCQIEAGSDDLYQFYGQAGEVIHIYHYSRQDTATVTLLDPDGIIIASQGGLEETISRKLTATGKYTIKFAYRTFSDPYYSFCLERVSPPSCSVPTLNLGQTFENEINPKGDADYYTFAGSAGDTITASASVLTGQTVYFEAYDPDGVPILSGDSYGAASANLLHSGWYTIRFRCGWLGSGSYRASLQCTGVCQDSGPPPCPTSTFFPQLAVGGGWSTVLTVTNTGYTTASGNLILTDQLGGSVIAKFEPGSIVGSSAPIVVPPAGTIFLTANAVNLTDATKSGWARLETTGGSVSGVATFQYSPSGVLRTAAGVLPSPSMQYATVPVDNDNTQERYTGYAVANPGSENLVVKMAVVDQDGKVVDDSVTIPLRPGEQVARFLHQDLSSKLKFKGSMVLRAQGGLSFVAVALLQNQGIYTVIPVSPGKAPKIPN
jgi:hypothetical protein